MSVIDRIAPIPRGSERGEWRHPAILLGVIGAVVGFAGSWIPSYWGDEAASVLSATRSWPSLGVMLTDIDGVHGLYYALLHVWVDLFGTSELATRLPSAVGVGVMVAGTVVLARRFTHSRTAVTAGIIALILPRATSMAEETRSYALGAAMAVWMTVLLVHLLHARAGRGGWIGYAVAVAASMYLFLYLGLLLLAHGVFVALAHRKSLGRWSRWAGVGLLLAAPILIIGYLQRAQIAFLARRDYATVQNVLIRQWFGYPLLAAVVWALIVVAVAVVAVTVTKGRRSDTGSAGSLTVLAGAWIVLPTGLLLIANATISPIYNVRYLSFCTPAAAILIALGISAIAAQVRLPRRQAVAAAILAVLVGLSVPTYVAQRTAWAKDGGSDLRAVADYIHTHADGGAVLFDQSTKPSRDPRLALDLYPTEFTGLRDVALETPYWDRPRLWDRVLANADTTSVIAGNADVWAVELTRASRVPADVALLQRLGYQIESSRLLHRTTIYHLVRRRIVEDVSRFA